MKKIAILHSGDLGNVSIGGISQYIQEIIKYETRYEVILFGTCEAGKYEIGKEYEKDIDGKKYTFIPVTDNSRSPLSVYYFLNLHRYFNIVEMCDVIYCQRMEYVLPFLFRKSKKKVVMAVHGSGAYTTLWRGRLVAFFYNIFERIAVNTANRVIVLQKRKEFGVPYYQDRYKNCAHKIFYGKVPVDNTIFRKICDEKCINEISDAFKIVYLGRVDNNPKRVLIFPDIIKKLIDDGYNVEFNIIGDGPSMEELIGKVKDYKLVSHFNILGKIDHGFELTKILNNQNVALILSSFEGICMSALECIACGVPVIATDVGDIKEYIRDGYNGAIVPNNEKTLVDNVAIEIEKILMNGCNLNEVYLEYTPLKMIQELEGIFEGE